MLVLARRIGEAIVVGEDVQITVLSRQGNQVRLGIRAPKSMHVDRQEIRLRRDEFVEAPIGLAGDDAFPRRPR